MFKLKSLKCIGFKRLTIAKPIEFPDDRLLIYGRNESGKSTIMEAIHYALYGQGLRPHKRASKDDLINYNQTQAIIELQFTIDDNLYTVKRIIRRKGTNRHELVIERPDGTKNRASGARKVKELMEQELHGIDSDALLNSCLVEQKELGKLESASRSDRIHAITSLLNIEAFVEGQQELNKTTNRLERTNLETANRLERAQQAKKFYDEASQKLEKAYVRIKVIEVQLAKLIKRIDELDKVLATIDEINKLDNEIKEKRASLEGKQGEIKRVIDSLKASIKAEELEEKIEKELPPIRLNLDVAARKVNALDRILKLQSQLENAYNEAERAKERLEDAVEKAEKSKVAKKRVKDLGVQIKEVEPVEKAQILLPSIEKLSKNLDEAQSEAARIQFYEKDLKSRLHALKDVVNNIKQLEQKEQNLQNTKAYISRKRTIGTFLAIIGLIVSIATTIVSPYLLALGLPLILTGILTVWRNSPTTIDPQLDSIRVEREDMLGEKARIDEYTSQLEETKITKIELTQKASGNRQELLKIHSQLPSKPREYAKIFKTDQPPIMFLTSLRNAIQQDLQSLIKLSTERDEAEKIATELEKRQQAVEEEKAKQKKASTNTKSLEDSKRDIEEKEEISPDQEQELRQAKDTLQNTVKELEVKLENAREKASEKEGLETEQTIIQESIQSLQQEIQVRAKEKTRLKEGMNITLGEEELREERDELKREIGSRETEKIEREIDIEESKKTIEDNKDLSEEHPKLVEKNNKEKFDIESMHRAMKLLEVTRDRIVAGVKGRIEIHMMRFLPSLTAQRYSMAQIDEKDYRIEVYDREARRWRGKGVFSGATQDQFSLALRLAFALSTIPSSRGARPGFIFLDEPLSGFDSQRADGLLDLLRGELFKHFEQIIVISHLEELKDEFPEQIQLEAGEIVVE